jgi:predicted ArsR family transcriptional regulator
MTDSRMQRTAWNRRLFASTRGRILALLRAEHRTVNDLAASLGLTDNAVRAHLLSLERDGLVQQHGTRRGRRRPHVTYGLSAEAEHIFPKAYGPLLNHVLNSLSDRLDVRAMRATMREVGRAVAKEHLGRAKEQTRRERIKAALELLADLGGSARFEDRGGRQFIRGRNGCPIAAITATHPDACLIIESLLSKIIGIPVRKCCQYGEMPHCCFELGR